MAKRQRVERMGLTALIFIALIAAPVGLILGGPAAIGASTLRVPPAAAYTYDSPPAPAANTHTNYDRGPPSARVDLHRHHADDLGSLGSSALADEGAASIAYHYDYLAMSAQGAHCSASTAATNIGPTRDLSSIQPGPVAADAETSAARVLARSPKAAREAQKPPGFNPETWQWREAHG
jgi:hypothetical protein